MLTGYLGRGSDRDRRDDFKQLEKRLRGEARTRSGITLSFNPSTKEHWIKTDFFGGWDDTKTSYRITAFHLKTTYKDIAFSRPRTSARWRTSRDEYYRNVYTLVIGASWSRDLPQLELRGPDGDRKTADTLMIVSTWFQQRPCARSRCTITGRQNIYVLDEIYERGLTNTALAVS